MAVKLVDQYIDCVKQVDMLREDVMRLRGYIEITKDDLTETKARAQKLRLNQRTRVESEKAMKLCDVLRECINAMEEDLNDAQWELIDAEWKLSKLMKRPTVQRYLKALAKVKA